MAEGTKRIVFCWEMGAGLGHVAAICVIADHFVANNDHCTFILPQAAALAQMRPEWAHRTNVHVIECPVWQVTNPSQFRNTRTHTFADVLSMFGFADAAHVLDVARWWDRQLGELQPDVVVAEFAPGCTIASRGAIPLVTIGNGYSVLPEVQPLPSMTSWSPEVPASSVESEAAIVESMARTRRQLGRPVLEYLAAAFRGDWTFPCTFRSLDPYHVVRTESVWLPFNVSYPQPSAGRSEHGRGFVYFSFPQPEFQRVLSLVVRQTVRACAIYAPAFRDWLAAQSPAPCHEIRSEPLDLRELGSYAFCMHHGGLGVATAAAIARIPQLLTPMNLEHAITAMALNRQGAALVALPEHVQSWRRPDDLARGMAAALSLPMNLHDEFQVTSSAASSSVAAIQRRIVDA